MANCSLAADYTDAANCMLASRSITAAREAGNAVRRGGSGGGNPRFARAEACYTFPRNSPFRGLRTALLQGE